MKRFVLVLLVVVSQTFGILAQVPQQFNYQAVLRNSLGVIIPSESVTADILILKGSETGTTVFTEQHVATTNNQGMMNLNIGSASDLSLIDWGADDYFMQVSINSTLLGTSQLLSVPYALYAGGGTGLWAKNGDKIHFTGGNVGIGTADPEVDLHVYDTDRPWLRVETPSANKWAIADLQVPEGTLQFSLLGKEAVGGGVILSGTANIDAIAAGGLNIINEDSAHIAFLTKGYHPEDEKVRITADGKVGVGTTDPAESLEVMGAFKVGDGGYSGITDGAITPEPAGGPGTIIFLDTHFYGWNGSSWQQLD